MSRPSTDNIGRGGVHGVGWIVTTDLGWKFREQHESDQGIDALIEVADNDRGTGRVLAAQIKGGSSWFREQSKTVPGWIFRPDERLVSYWLNHDLPVVVVLYDIAGRTAYWEHVTEAKLEDTRTGGKRLTIPRANVLGVATASQLRGVVDSFVPLRHRPGSVPHPPHPPSPPTEPSGRGRIRAFGTHDAVVIIPGFAGSELVDVESGRTLWGLSDLRWYVRAWSGGDGMASLAVAPEERGGAKRVAAARLLRFPAYLPALGGMEPYTKLAAHIRSLVAHPDAVLEFPYDWRLGADVNARLLQQRAGQHLSEWRRRREAGRDAELVLVAHSTGGLIAQYFSGVLGGHEIVRSTVTLGTPFGGSLAAVRMISHGQSVPYRLPAEVFRTFPGIYDMVPSYPCVHYEAGLRQLSSYDVVELGGDPELTEQASQRRAVGGQADIGPLTAVVGVGQPTTHAIRLLEGGPEYVRGSAGSDHPAALLGDSLVIPEAATRNGANVVYVAQTNGALARSSAAATAVTMAVASRADMGPLL